MFAIQEQAGCSTRFKCFIDTPAFHETTKPIGNLRKKETDVQNLELFSVPLALLSIPLRTVHSF